MAVEEPLSARRCAGEACVVDATGCCQGNVVHKMVYVHPVARLLIGLWI